VRYRVTCTIKTINTDISCDIDIGHSRKGKETGYYEWAKFAGRLYLNPEYGRWMYRIDGSNNIMGISLCATSDTKDPYFFDPANLLVELNNVPENFAEKLACGDDLNGNGTLFRTCEEIVWRMWNPC